MGSQKNGRSSQRSNIGKSVKQIYRTQVFLKDLCTCKRDLANWSCTHRLWFFPLDQSGIKCSLPEGVASRQISIIQRRIPMPCTVE